MRILVHEFVSGGGLAGRRVPATLAREGSAMLSAVIADLAATGCHRIITTADPRFPPGVPAGVEVVMLYPGLRGRAVGLDALIGSVDAVWFVAPETGGCLERLAVMAERQGTVLIGPGSAAIRRASDKGALARRLERHGVTYPPTRVMRRGSDWAEWRTSVRKLGYPVVVKPRRGAGCQGVGLARNAGELRRCVDMALEIGGRGSLLLQRFVPGVAASVSLLADGRRAVALATSTQSIRFAGSFGYRGGTTPLVHPLARRGTDLAVRACQVLGGLRGYIGVDVVLTDSEAVVIEINPRLTTAYLGVRAALGENVAALALAASCSGVLPRALPARQRVRFTAAGRIVSAFPAGL